MPALAVAAAVPIVAALSLAGAGRRGRRRLAGPLHLQLRGRRRKQAQEAQEAQEALAYRGQYQPTPPPRCGGGSW